MPDIEMKIFHYRRLLRQTINFNCIKEVQIMNKKVLVICGSPRKGGNSDTLCDLFIKGCTEVGNFAEKYICVINKLIFVQLAMPVKRQGNVFKRMI